MSNPPLDRPLAPASDAVAGCAGLRWRHGRMEPVEETLVVEEPLALEIAYEKLGQDVVRVLSVTMRTPGADAELALGFLYCEALVDEAPDVVAGELLSQNSRGQAIPTWRARLARAPRSQEVERVSRGIITSAACGVCGRTSLEGLRAARAAGTAQVPEVGGEEILALTGKLRGLQAIYPGTGGCHGAGLFDEAGEALFVREDVGRHNAVDKVIGAALMAGQPTAGRTLVLSGRAGFELIQKAAAAGMSLVVSVGAPSSFAVTLAAQSSITLVGFARDGKFNVYSQSGRLIRG